MELGRRKDGSEFPIEVGLNPMETAEGTLVISGINALIVRARDRDELFRDACRIAAVVDACCRLFGQQRFPFSPALPSR